MNALLILIPLSLVLLQLLASLALLRAPWVNLVQIHPNTRTWMSLRSALGGRRRVVLEGSRVTARRVSRRRW